MHALMWKKVFPAHAYTRIRHAWDNVVFPFCILSDWTIYRYRLSPFLFMGLKNKFWLKTVSKCLSKCIGNTNRLTTEIFCENLIYWISVCCFCDIYPCIIHACAPLYMYYFHVWNTCRVSLIFIQIHCSP